MGCDYNDPRNPTAVGPGGKFRLDEAIALGRRVLFGAEWGSVEVIFVVAPGTEPSRRQADQQTMASMMAAYLKSNMPSCEVLANSCDPEVWGSMDEVDWAWQAVQAHRYGKNTMGNSASRLEMSDTEMAFVSSTRHLRRVRKILQIFHGLIPGYVMVSVEHDVDDEGSVRVIPMMPEVGLVPSADPPPSWWHEFKAHVRMYAYAWDKGEEFDAWYQRWVAWCSR